MVDNSIKKTLKSKAKSVMRDLWHNDCPFKEKIVPLKEKNTFTLTSPNTFLMSRSPTLIPMWKRTSSSICFRWSLLTNCEADDESVPLNKSKTFWIWWICGRYTNEHFIIPDVKCWSIIISLALVAGESAVDQQNIPLLIV